MTITRRPIALLGAFTGAASLLAGLTACAPGYNMVRTNPGLYPTFQLSVVDYVNRCDPTKPTKVSVEAPRGTTVSIDGQPARRGSFTAKLDQQVNERFTIVVSTDGERTTHHVRCLPRDFPQWEAARSGKPQARFYATVIQDRNFAPSYPVIFDTNGVPVWWTERTPTPLLTPISQNRFATTNFGGGMIERKLDGTVTRILNTHGATSDFHDVVRKPNGNYVMATFEVRPCNLAPWGGGPPRCAFHDFQELTPAGDVVWHWRPESDIPLRETSGKWRSIRGEGGWADPWHYNSVEWTGDGFIVSFRHMDAVYKLDYDTKDVVWKLGGSRRPESLRVIGDPVFDAGGSISGQHDARRRRGGVVTLFDNGSLTGRAPRSVAYKVDEAAMTATRTRRVSDSIAPASPCCGSTRVIPGGNHVTGWGGSRWITENKPNGKQVFRLDATFVYRGIPLLPGQYNRSELRAGMDAQFDDGQLVPAARAPGTPEPQDVGDLRVRLGLSDDANVGD
jgi:hypothetical protein